MNNDDMSEMVNNLFNMINKEKDNISNQNTPTGENIGNSFNTNNIDLETIMKMKTIIDKMNTKNDPRSNLLLSLKPYLNDNRKSKIDQYINLMNMSKVLEVFPYMGGDQKNG